MSYEAAIASFKENTTTLANPFIMASRGVAQTWYSSLCPRSINRWQQLKRQLLTSFQDFQTHTASATGSVAVIAYFEQPHITDTSFVKIGVAIEEELGGTIDKRSERLTDVADIEGQVIIDQHQAIHVLQIFDPESNEEEDTRSKVCAVFHNCSIDYF